MKTAFTESKSPIRITGEDLSIDELCNLAMKEALLLKEIESNIDIS